MFSAGPCLIKCLHIWIIFQHLTIRRFIHQQGWESSSGGYLRLWWTFSTRERCQGSNWRWWRMMMKNFWINSSLTMSKLFLTSKTIILGVLCLRQIRKISAFASKAHIDPLKFWTQIFFSSFSLLEYFVLVLQSSWTVEEGFAVEESLENVEYVWKVRKREFIIQLSLVFVQFLGEHHSSQLHLTNWER